MERKLEHRHAWVMAEYGVYCADLRCYVRAPAEVWGRAIAVFSETEGKTMARWGTNHFRYKSDIVSYYAKQGFSEHDALAKLASEEVALGLPVAHPGDKVTIDDDGRYWLEDWL